MTLKLYVFPLSPRAFKALFAANQAGVDYELKFVDLRKGEQNSPEFLKLNPNGRMPVVDDDGYVLWESNAIVNYFAAKKPQSGLLPEDTKARLQVEKWQFWESVHWDQACAIFAFERLVKKLFRGEPESASEIARGTQMMERLAKVLDGELGKHRYVAGERLTVADISIGATMSIADITQFPLEPYRHIARWREELKALPAWVKTVELQQKFMAG
jgi:glutathione S-transferase